MLDGTAPEKQQEEVAKKLNFSGTAFIKGVSQGREEGGREAPRSEDHRSPTDEDPEGHLQPGAVVVTNLEHNINETSATQVRSEVNMFASLAAARKTFSFSLPEGHLDPIPLSSSEEEPLSQTVMLSSPEEEPSSPKPTNFTLAEELEEQLELFAEEPLARELESDLQQAEEQHVALGNITPPHKRRTASAAVSPSQ